MRVARYIAGVEVGEREVGGDAAAVSFINHNLDMGRGRTYLVARREVLM